MDMRLPNEYAGTVEVGFTFIKVNANTGVNTRIFECMDDNTNTSKHWRQYPTKTNTQIDIKNR